MDKVNVEAVQANLKKNFERIAIKHHEEVTKLLAKQLDNVDKIEQDYLRLENLLALLQHKQRRIT